MSTFADHIKKFKKAAYRNFITKRFRRHKRKTKSDDKLDVSLPQFDLDLKSLYQRELPDEAWVRLTLPLFGKTHLVSYKMPLTMRQVHKILDDTYFEVTTLDGQSMESALETMFNDEYSTFSQEEIDNIEHTYKNPKEPTEAALRAKNQALALLDLIQEENDLTRYQAYYVFGQVFISGGLGSAEETNGDIIEAGMKRVRNYLEIEGVEDHVRNLEKPSTRPAPLNVQAARPTSRKQGKPNEVKNFMQGGDSEITFNGRSFSNVKDFMDFMRKSDPARNADDQDTDG